MSVRSGNGGFGFGRPWTEHTYGDGLGTGARKISTQSPVVRQGGVVEARGYGFENLETRTPASAKEVYKIGSISKQFLAAGIMHECPGSAGDRLGSCRSVRAHGVALQR